MQSIIIRRGDFIIIKIYGLITIALIMCIPAYIQLWVVIAPGPLVLSGTFRLPITMTAAIVDGHLNVLVIGHGGGDSGWSKKQRLSRKEERKC